MTIDKVTTSSKNVTPFVGLNLIYKALFKKELPKFIDQQLGCRNIRAEYSYSDIVLSLLGNALCQGSYIADLKELKEKFNNQYFKNIPSADTVEYACQELKLPNAIEISDSGVEHQINFNNNNYYGIMTNNKEFTNKEVIEFYNDRGDAENSNRYLLNDFNLHHLPFPDMDMNTVFMYLMAMGAILFEWIKLVLVKNKTRGIKLNMRVKAICFKYITIASIFISRSRQKILQVFSGYEYKILEV